jgi:hypothetical protein
MISTRRLSTGILFALLLLAPLHAADKNARRKFRFEGISFGYEARHDRLRFEFHNPVASSGSALIPHRFVQTYTTDNQWGTLRGRYLVLGIPWETEFGATPSRTNYGDDYDTTFDPSGDVSVAGTFGNVSMRSYRFLQRAALSKAKGIVFSAAYDYHLDRSQFQFGNSFETHTQPPSSVYEKLPIQETTRSRFHRIELGGRRDWNLSPRCRLIAEANLAPVTLAYLSVILPAKYPGEELVFLAKAFGVSSRLALLWVTGSFPIELYADYGRDWNYGSSNEVRREFFALGLRLGWNRH